MTPLPFWFAIVLSWRQTVTAHGMGYPQICTTKGSCATIQGEQPKPDTT